ncbi:hypothetical protein G9U51_13785 [Calidifontibacter sp. DB0510]|uniref:Fido domain-containing protein n=1 Tax=Metallococcus carri TaxID=1656884 RepID=A0A967B2M3_9MICO|nr:Fic family protein [Metallococcus carri]NHN56844.1 hypothetical protein [Metallococcus carri]NOP37779.1 hypothetical protein [Calidifontibacter sp. DB2511S]
MSQIVNAVAALRRLPQVEDAVEEARQACTQLRWHAALRRRTAEAAAESRVRGARASAALEGATLPLDLVRQRFGQPVDADDPVDRAVAAAIRVTAETEAVQATFRSAPAQALARLHVAASAADDDPATVGRPRLVGERSPELAELGAPPDAVEAGQRLQQVIDLIHAAADQPVALVAAVVHAELATVRPFVRGNLLVARAAERALLWGGGLDPTGVAVPEVGHERAGPAYLGSLAGYHLGGGEGVRQWILHCAGGYAAGAAEGTAIADAVLAGRLSGQGLVGGGSKE